MVAMAVGMAVAARPKAPLDAGPHRPGDDDELTRLRAQVADRLPAEDASCDAGVASLVLCSVADQAAALAELHRVIRQGGELRFYEHIRSDSPGFARFQRAVDVVWPHLGGGCHASRATLDEIEAAGFTIEQARRFTFRPSAVTIQVSPHAIGIASRRA